MSEKILGSVLHLPESLPEVAQLTAQLVSIESTDPGTFEADVETFVKHWIFENCMFELAGSTYPLIQEVEALPGRKCLRATIPNVSRKVSKDVSCPPSDLTFICHMDTVTDGDGWSPETPAFAPVYKDGLLYGRGFMRYERRSCLRASCLQRCVSSRCPHRHAPQKIPFRHLYR